MSKKTTEDRNRPLPRRDFLKGAAFTAAAAATVAGNTPSEAAEDKTEESSGYRETEHVRAYYDLARF